MFTNKLYKSLCHAMISASKMVRAVRKSTLQTVICFSINSLSDTTLILLKADN